MDISNYATLNKYFTKCLLQKYPNDHYFFEIDRCNQVDIKENFFTSLDKIFCKVENVFGDEACKAYSKKLICKSHDKFDRNIFNSYFTELLVVYLIISQLKANIVKSKYEPTVNNSKHSELKIHTFGEELNVEVKVLDFSKTFDSVLLEAMNKNCYIFKEYLPLDEDLIEKIDKYLKLRENLTIKKMVYYKSEISKINNIIKKANDQFENQEKFNILFINYNMGLHPIEVLKCVLDPIRGIVFTNQNLSNIDAIVVLSLSIKCYSLEDINHSRSNVTVIINPNRGSEVKKVLERLGFESFIDNVQDFPDWDIYKIIMFDDIHQYVIVPYWSDNEEVIKEVKDFIT